MNAQFRNTIVRAVSAELAIAESSLASVGLVAEFRGLIERDGENPMSVRSLEAEIGIYSNGQLIDVVEFFVELDGKPVVDPQEVRDWLRTELSKVVDDYPTGRGWEAV